MFQGNSIVGDIDGVVETAFASYVVESKMHGKVLYTTACRYYDLQGKYRSCLTNTNLQVFDISCALKAATLVNNDSTEPLLLTKNKPVIVVLAVSDGATQELRDHAAASNVLLLVQEDGEFKLV